jgi:signal transduction histidine kinase
MWKPSRQILVLTTRGLSTTSYFREALGLILDHSRGRSSEICLKEGEEHRHFSAFWTEAGEVDLQLDRPRRISSEASCVLTIWNMIREVVAKSQPSSAGAFWARDGQAEVRRILGSSSSVALPALDLGEEEASLAIVPIRGGSGEELGLLRVTGSPEHRFESADVERIEAMTDAMGLGILNLRIQSALQERVKELACLYDITKLVENPDKSLDENLQSIAELLPPAWQYPEIASARIVLDGKHFATSESSDICHTMRSDIVIEGRRRGVVEVCYTQEMPTLDEGPFLREERSLLDAIAKQVALIIERKEAEESQEKLEDQLRHADRLATIGQLAAGVAHELNEPLSNILGFAQLAAKHEGITSEVLEDLDKIVSASLYSREVIKKLMLFSRQTPPVKTIIDLNAVLEESLALLEGRCIKLGIEITRSLESDLPPITADAGQINQVIVNLIVNAIHAMPDGGKLGIRTAGTEGDVVLGVMDTGTGMKAEVLEKIFLPFYTTKDVNEGTGLGLAVVNGIVTSHGGFIRVDSTPGKGSTFEVHLPLSGASTYATRDGR